MKQPWPWTGLGCDLCGFGSVENQDEFDPEKRCPECGTVMLYMNFSEALERAKRGDKIAREGWNGKNMWVCYMPPFDLPEGNINERTRKFIPGHVGGLKVLGYFVMWTQKGEWMPGWLCFADRYARRGLVRYVSVKSI